MKFHLLFDTDEFTTYPFLMNHSDNSHLKTLFRGGSET